MDNFTLNLILIIILLLIILLISYLIYKKLIKKPPVENFIDHVRDETKLMKGGKLGPIGGAAIGVLFGALVEEIAEQVFDLPNLGPLGEVLGGITGGIWGAKTLKKFHDAQRTLLKYAARELGKKQDIDEMSEKELKDLFKNIPKQKRFEILNKFKDIAPYEYGLIREIIEKQIEKETIHA